MESITDLIKIQLFAAWRRRWYALAAAWAVCMVGWIAVSQFPDKYEVTARLHVDTDAVLIPLLRGLAVDTATASQAELMQKTLLTRTNLEKLVSISFPEVARGPEADRERVMRSLATSIHVTSSGRDLFTLTYRDNDAQAAYNVVSAALKIFLDNQTEAAQTDMDSAQRFLRAQIATYEQQLSEAEHRRAEFRTKYFDILPGEGHSPSRLEMSRQALAKLEADYSDNKLRLDVLKEQMRSIPQVLPMDGVSIGAGGAVAVSPVQQQLFEAERNLKLLQLRLTDSHPDVIAAKRLVDILKASASKSGPDGTARTLSNPVYEQVRIQIVDRETTLASLSAQIAKAREETDRLEKLAREVPSVEADYSRLDRDYSVLQKNYNELVARLEQARIANAANTTTDGKIRVLDPPRIPQVPVAPKRLLLISAVLAGGLIAGAAIIAVWEQLDGSLGSLPRLRRVGVPVLGAISLINRRPRWSDVLRVGGFAFALMCLLVVYGGLIIRASGIGLMV